MRRSATGSGTPRGWVWVVQGCSRNLADGGVHATTLLNGSLIILYANNILSEGRCRGGEQKHDDMKRVKS